MIAPSASSRRQIFFIAGGIFVLIVIFTLHRSTTLTINSQYEHDVPVSSEGGAESQQQREQGDGEFSVPTMTVTAMERVTVTASPNLAVGAPTSPGEFRNPLAKTREECLEEYPGLFEEIERVVRLRNGKKIVQKDLDSEYLRRFEGYTRVLIFEGKLYVLESQPEPKFSRRLASLHALDRAISTSPFPLPNIEFNLNIWDQVNTDALTWALTRKITDEPIQNNWLMPDFGLWSWPEPKVGSYYEVLKKADEVDDEYLAEGTTEHTLAGKRDKAVWRGAVLGSHVRQKLVELTQNKKWADVKVLDWGNKDALKKSLLSMSDHCRYKYVLHTEGYSYSGRLKYLQACHSVVIIHKMEWTQHYYPLLRKDGPDQNYVEVKRDWSDLEAKIEYLEANPEVADGIAKRGREVVRKYQGEAANACYWREMIRAWSELQDWEPSLYKGKGGKEWRGVPWESFAIMQKTNWDAA